MTTGTTQTQLQAWWNTTDFQGKDNFSLNDNNELVLVSNGSDIQERVITTIDNPDDADIVLKALIDKFAEVEAKVDEVKKEWQVAEDKSKLFGKVERLKHYLMHANAAGNFHSLLKEVSEWEQELKKTEEANYAAKLQIVEKAAEAAKSENYKEATQELKNLTEEWKNSGYIEKERNDELWNRLEAIKNDFFERKRQFQEEHEKELLHNLDLKLEIVEKAEHLAASDDWKSSTETFKQLMEEWKGIGRTTAEKNEELWHRFITAKNTFYDRKKLHFESIQQEQEENLKLKEALVAKAEEMKTSTDWHATTQAFADLMEQWKQIGRVPADKADEVWARLNATRDHFFQNKKQHFESFKLSLEDNYAQKLALLKRAQSLQDSTRWREATNEMNELMTEWKKIGPVPREHSDRIWEEFLSARKTFFAHKDADRERRIENAEKHKSKRLHQTKSFLKKLEEELKEEQDKLDDFKEGIKNITPGHKEEELRAHLTKLISQTEHKVQHKQEKIDAVRKQLQELEEKAQKA